MRAQDEAREMGTEGATEGATEGGRSTVSRRGLLRGGAGALAGGTTALAARAACAPGGAPAAGQPAGSSKAPATVRFAAAGVGTELQIWTEVVESYNALGTGITVQYEPCTAG